MFIPDNTRIVSLGSALMSHAMNLPALSAPQQWPSHAPHHDMSFNPAEILMGWSGRAPASPVRILDARQEPSHDPLLTITATAEFVLLNRLLRKGRSLLLGCSLVFWQRHPFTNDFSACVVFWFHVGIFRYGSAIAASSCQKPGQRLSVSSARSICAKLDPFKPRRWSYSRRYCGFF